MKQRLFAELFHFKQLSLTSRQILTSSAIYELAYPILFTFLSAFLFRSTGGFLASVLFNLGLMTGVPTGFYVNGLLLKRWHIKRLLAIGLLGEGLVASMVFFLPSITPVAILGIGLMQGFPMGLYFANRNFLTLSVTQDNHRSYYTGLEQIISNFAGVVSPLIAGWALVFGARTGVFSLQQIYQILAVTATVGLVVAGRSFF
jgi:MFS transporter, YQGE family, putative transporter